MNKSAFVFFISFHPDAKIYDKLLNNRKFFLDSLGKADLTFFIAFLIDCGVLKTFDGDAAGLEAGFSSSDLN